jgi:hypothetical protein
MRVPPYAYGQIDPLTFLLFCYIGHSVENPKSKSAKTNCGEVRSFPTAHRTKPCTPQTDHKNLRVRRCVRVVPTRHSRPLSHAQRRTQFPLANMVRARTSLGASSRAAGGRGDASRLASRVVARFRASRSVSAFHRALATRAIGIARAGDDQATRDAPRRRRRVLRCAMSPSPPRVRRSLGRRAAAAASRRADRAVVLLGFSSVCSRMMMLVWDALRLSSSLDVSLTFSSSLPVSPHPHPIPTAP